MIWVLSARSERQRAQRRCEAWPERYGWSGEEAVSIDASLLVDVVLSVLLLRWRKGREGTRYVGKRVGGDSDDGNGIPSESSRRFRVGSDKDSTSDLP